MMLGVTLMAENLTGDALLLSLQEGSLVVQEAVVNIWAEGLLLVPASIVG